MVEANLTGKRSRRARRTILMVLPAYNEAQGIGSLLDSIDDAMAETDELYRVFVVDDGSSDATLEVVTGYVAEMPITVMRHERNQGLGATIRDGLVAAEKASGDGDIIVTMDADDTHLPGLIARMVRMIAEGHDVVIASRYQPGSRVRGVPVHRQLLSYAASILFRLVLPIRGVKDFTSGFRAYRGAVVKKAIAEYGETFVEQAGFQCMVDILLKLRKLNLLFGEVPILLRYDLKADKSKMNVGETAWKTLGLLLRRRFFG